MFASYSRLARRAAAPGVIVSSLTLWSESRLATAATSSKSTTMTARLLSSSSASSSGFVPWYESHLSQRPVLTKAVTGGILWGVGDAVAQALTPASNNNKDYSNDWSRTGRACFFGFALHAPLSHLHFNFLEWMTVKSRLVGLQIPVFKTIMEQFVYWSWISNGLYHGAMGAMQGQSLQESWDYIQSVIWETQKAQWLFWIPVQLLNFRYVPVRHQLNVVLLTSIAWTALLSMWYPPIMDETTVIDTTDEHHASELKDFPVM